MKTQSKHCMFVVFLVLSLSLGCTKTIAQSDLILEWEQHWDTYGKGGTCCYGTDNFFVGDIDNDGTQELITGGFSYKTENNTRISFEAPLKIWNWNGKELVCENTQTWNGSIRTVHASDIDNDGLTEIITGGTARNTSNQISQINIWTYDGFEIAQKGTYDGISAHSIFVTKLNDDQKPVILTAGRTIKENQSLAQLSIFQWKENKLTLLDSQEWSSSTEAYAYSVFASDLNNDNEIEIITAGFDNGLTNSTGQLRIWRWNGNQLVLQTNMEWQTIPNAYGVTISGQPMGNTAVNDLKVGDVDSDGVPEIITGGWTYDGSVFNAQLRIWSWDGDRLSLENSHEWISEDITEIKSVSLSDVDKDNQVEIVTSGLTSVYGSFNNTECNPDHAQLRIWSWNGHNLVLKLSKDWTVGDGVVAWNLGTGDIDNDNTVEIITVGCMGESGACDPNLRIWSIASRTNSTDQNHQIIILTGATILILLGIVIVYIKRK
ncbi:MAG: hypothetical protein NUK63_04240 [Candidatus Bathyarchaeum tardum]|nr:MAG: hypothetical protein NUK63_04240 [Candidatus Bathyarchaeum tardum]